MIVLMNEFVQGKEIAGKDVLTGDYLATLEAGRQYVVGEELGKWLLEHRKASAVTVTPAPEYKAVVTLEAEEEDPVFEPLPEITDLDTEPKVGKPRSKKRRKP